MVTVAVTFSHLLLLLIFEPEGCLDAASLVQESSPHVDVDDIPDEPADKVDAEVVDNVRRQLGCVVVLVKLGVDVVHRVLNDRSEGDGND